MGMVRSSDSDNRNLSLPLTVKDVDLDRNNSHPSYGSVPTTDVSCNVFVQNHSGRAGGGRMDHPMADPSNTLVECRFCFKDPPEEVRGINKCDISCIAIIFGGYFLQMWLNISGGKRTSLFVTALISIPTGCAGFYFPSRLLFWMMTRGTLLHAVFHPEWWGWWAVPGICFACFLLLLVCYAMAYFNLFTVVVMHSLCGC